MVVLPLINAQDLNTVYTAGSTIRLNRVLNPFSYDLPNYVIFLTKQDGVLVTQKEYVNQGTDAFYNNSMRELDMDCADFALGVLNTFCTVTFRPFNFIQRKAQVRLTFTGIKVFTDQCTVFH